MTKPRIPFMALAIAASALVPAFAQDGTIRAKVTGEGGDGKCTFEVEVEGVAEVEIRGAEGYLRTVSGLPARWRRLDCNQALPQNPASFQFKGIDGRGNQKLVRDPAPTAESLSSRLKTPRTAVTATPATSPGMAALRHRSGHLEATRPAPSARVPRASGRDKGGAPVGAIPSASPARAMGTSTVTAGRATTFEAPVSTSIALPAASMPHSTPNAAPAR